VPVGAKIDPLIEKDLVDEHRPEKLAGLTAFAPLMANAIGVGLAVAVGSAVGVELGAVVGVGNGVAVG
jgi:hypothetical protein